MRVYNIGCIANIFVISTFGKMMFKAILLSAIVGVAFSAYTFPDDFQSCPAPTNSSCLIDLLQDALTKLGTEGISSPIDFDIKSVKVPFWTFTVDTDVVKTHEYFWNVSHTSLWNSTVLSASFNSSSLNLQYSTNLEHLIQFNEYYEIWGELYYGNDSDPEIVYGSGKADKHLHDVALDHDIVFETVSINETEYFVIKTYDLTVKSYNNVTFNFHNLYDGEETKAQRALNLINANTIPIVNQQADVLRVLLLTMYKLYTQRLITSVPASKILEHLSA